MKTELKTLADQDDQDNGLDKPDDEDEQVEDDDLEDGDSDKERTSRIDAANAVRQPALQLQQASARQATERTGLVSTALPATTNAAYTRRSIYPTVQQPMQPPLQPVYSAVGGDVDDGRSYFTKHFSMLDKLMYIGRELFSTYAFLTLAMLASTQMVLIGYGALGVVWMHAAALLAVSFATGAVCNPTLVFARWLFRWYDTTRVERCGIFGMIAIIVGQFMAGIMAGVTVEFFCGIDVSVAVPDAVNMIAVQAGETPTEAGLSTAQACLITLVTSTLMISFQMVHLPRYLGFAEALVLSAALAASEGAGVSFIGAGCLNPAYQLGANLVSVNIMPFRSITFVYYVFAPAAAVLGGIFAFFFSLRYDDMYLAYLSERQNSLLLPQPIQPVVQISR